MPVSLILVRSRVLGLPALLCSDELSSSFTDSKNSDHRVDGRHLREDTSVDNAELADATDLKLRVDDSHLIALNVTHLGGTGRMVDGVGNAARILADLLISLNLGARGNLLLQPLLEGTCLSDLASSLDAVDENATTGSRTGDVRCHAEGISVLDNGVSQSLGVEMEGDLVAVHHDIGRIAIVASSVRGLSSQEDTGVGIHGCLVGRNSLVELPHDDGLGVIQEVLTNTGDILDDGDLEVLELSLGANTGMKKESRGIYCTSRQDNLLARMEGMLLAGLQGNIDSGSHIVLDNDLGNMSLRKDRQVGSSLIATENGVNVGNRSTAAVTGVGVVRDREETSALGQLALLGDFVVEVVDDGNAHGLRASLDPVLGQLVAMTAVDGVQLVAQVVDVAHNSLEIPTLAALSDPTIHIVAEGTE
ncbi:hypothetical protein HG530_010304 [Fusarium avenaceum]|nr:hypothetical protein HG530_010304 [Fusarium avenaceum]